MNYGTKTCDYKAKVFGNRGFFIFAHFITGCPLSTALAKNEGIMVCNIKNVWTSPSTKVHTDAIILTIRCEARVR